MREKHATVTIAVLNSILDHKDLIDRFFVATENGQCPEDVKKEMEAAGIAPDRSFIQSAINQYGRQFSLKAARFIELDKRKRNAAEKAEFHKLNRKLTARGLDPKHCGLAERAAILDNIKYVQKYLEATKYGGNCPDDVRKALKEAGIQLNRRHIQTTLNEIRQNAKAAERLKRSMKSRSKHNDTTLEEELELAASEDDDAENPEETEEVDIAETA